MNKKQNEYELTTVVLFGASGDLAEKKVLPSLFNLFKKKKLLNKIRLIGYSRSSYDKSEFIKKRFGGLDKSDVASYNKFTENFIYFSASYTEERDYQRLEKLISERENNVETTEIQRMFYFAIPPSIYVDILKNLKMHVYKQLVTNKVIIEKPFGHDLDSSRALQYQIDPLFMESEIYRIDHYLGKNMVKNFIDLRSQSSILEDRWNREYIKSIEICLKEDFGTYGRGGYFDCFGIIRDVIQNHLIQILSLVTMEKPKSNDGKSIMEEKIKVLKCFDPIDLNNYLIAQYTCSSDGKNLGYLDDETVDKNSKTPTFTAIIFSINNDRWKGVKFLVLAGKALDEAKVEIKVNYKTEKYNLNDQIDEKLIVKIQPTQACYFVKNSQKIDLLKTIDTSKNNNSAYENLIGNCYHGDKSIFVGKEELELSWRLITPLLNDIKLNHSNFIQKYPFGSSGPSSLDTFLKKNGLL